MKYAKKQETGAEVSKQSLPKLGSKVDIPIKCDSLRESNSRIPKPNEKASHVFSCDCVLAWNEHHKLIEPVNYEPMVKHMVFLLG